MCIQFKLYLNANYVTVRPYKGYIAKNVTIPNVESQLKAVSALEAVDATNKVRSRPHFTRPTANNYVNSPVYNYTMKLVPLLRIIFISVDVRK